MALVHILFSGSMDGVYSVLHFAWNGAAESKETGICSIGQTASLRSIEQLVQLLIASKSHVHLHGCNGVYTSFSR